MISLWASPGEDTTETIDEQLTVKNDFAFDCKTVK
jgi:hypothetical protein